MHFYLIAPRESFFTVVEKKVKRCSARESADILLKSSTLQFSMFYVEAEIYCVYDDDLHVYVKFSRVGFNLVVSKLLGLAKYASLLDYDYVRKVVDNLGLSEGYSKLGLPVVTSGFLVFSDCLYDLKKKCTVDFDKRLIIFSYLPFEYKTDQDMSVFLEFLEEFCEGYSDRVEFIRNFLYVILNGPGRLQVFFHFHGPGGTGKTTLANLCRCLVGTGATVTSDLRTITKNPFEAFNLANMKLILISESNTKIEDTSVLKMITGGDALAGRKKHVQGTFEVLIEGVVAIFNNDEFNTKDDSGAILRRIRPFLAKGKVKEKKDLIRICKINGWTGLLVKEVPAIVNWVSVLDEQDVYSFFENMKDSVPSLANEIKINQMTFNPILLWIEQQVVKGKGLYVGMISKFGVKEMIEMKQRKTLYPVYQVWCQNHGPLWLTPKGSSKSNI